MVWSTILFVYSNRPIRDKVMNKKEEQHEWDSSFASKKGYTN